MATTTILGVTLFATDASDTSKYVLFNDALNEFEDGITEKHDLALTTGTETVTALEASNRILDATGTLTGNTVVELPASRVGVWVFKNGTTGAFTVDVTINGGGAGTRITQGSTTWIYADAADVFPIPNTGTTKL